MGIITISRQIGAGETTIAPAVAERLGWETLDHKILDRQVEEAGATLPRVAHYDERAPGVIETWRHPIEPQKYFQALKRVMREIAARGNVIVVGRGGNFLLAEPGALHVRLVADLAFRIQRVMELRWVNEGPAREIIEKCDRERAAFVRHYFDADVNDPLHYDMVLNTSRLGIEGVIETLTNEARRRWPPSAPNTEAAS
jgi:cytidylate kinase